MEKPGVEMEKGWMRLLLAMMRAKMVSLAMWGRKKVRANARGKKTRTEKKHALVTLVMTRLREKKKGDVESKSESKAPMGKDENEEHNDRRSEADSGLSN